MNKNAYKINVSCNLFANLSNRLLIYWSACLFIQKIMFRCPLANFHWTRFNENCQTHLRARISNFWAATTQKWVSCLIFSPYGRHRDRPEETIITQSATACYFSTRKQPQFFILGGMMMNIHINFSGDLYLHWSHMSRPSWATKLKTYKIGYFLQ